MNRRCLGIVAAAGLLAGCGGGGGDGSPHTTAATTAFPLKAAYEAYSRTAETYTYDVTGSCSGTATETDSATGPAIFNGQPTQVKTSTVRVNIDRCNSTFAGQIPAGSSVNIMQTFFDSQMRPIAISMQGLGTLVATTPISIPASVVINDTGILTDGSVMTVGYSVQPDTDTTAFVPITFQIHSTTGAQIGMEIQTFRISTAGMFQLVKDEVRLGNGAQLILSPRT